MRSMEDGDVGPRAQAFAAWLVQYGVPVFCALMLALAAFGAFQLKAGQDEIARLLTPATRATRTLWVDWTCIDGEAVHVEATSEINEPRESFFSRFDADVAAREIAHPRR